MLPYQILKNAAPDKMRFAFFLVFVMSSALKKVLTCIKSACSAIIHLITTVIAIHQAGENTAFARFGPAVPAFTDFLNFFKGFHINNRHMGIRSNNLILDWISSLLFITLLFYIAFISFRQAGRFQQELFLTRDCRSSLSACFVYKIISASKAFRPIFGLYA